MTIQAKINDRGLKQVLNKYNMQVIHEDNDTYTLEDMNQKRSMTHGAIIGNFKTDKELLNYLEDIKRTDTDFKSFKNAVNGMSLVEFKAFQRTMFRTFNFINAIEDMDISEVNTLQAEPVETNITMTSKELYTFFNDVLLMDIE